MTDPVHILVLAWFHLRDHVRRRPGTVLPILLLALLCAPHQGYSAEQTSEDGLALVTKGYLLDDSGIATLDDFLQGQREMHPGSVNGSQGRSHGTLWLQAELSAHPARAGHIVEIPYPHLREVTAYWVQDRRLLATDNGGYTRPVKSGVPCRGECFVVPPADEGPLTLILAVRSDSPLIVSFQLYTPAEHQWHTRIDGIMLGFFYGAFLVMFFYNLFVYVSTRATEYLLYDIYIASVCVWIASHDGTLRDFVLGPDSALSGYDFHLTLTLFGVIAGGVFSRSFLNTRKHAPASDLLFRALIVAGMIGIVWVVVSPATFYAPLANTLTLLMTGLAICCAIVALRKGELMARYFLVAWVSVVVATLVWVLTISGYLPYTRSAGLYVHIGCLLETVLLALALADRINQLQHEHNRLQTTARRQLEEANRKLSAANRFKDEFLSTVSHELRTPMNGVIGSTDLLTQTTLTDEQKLYLTNIQRSSQNMMRLVEDILTYTQLDAARYSIENGPVDLFQLFEAVTQHYRAHAQAKGLTFSGQIAAQIPKKLRGDAHKLRIIINHVLDNACKFTEHGGVRMSFSPVEGPESEADIWIRFSVSDTGIGVAPDMQGKIFELFRQVDGSMTRKQGGLGIGLALCKRITHLMGGRFEFVSDVGRGTDVHIYLPFMLGDIDAGEPATTTPMLLKSRDQTRILVVEDNQVNRMVLDGIIRKLGYQTLSAVNGEECLQLLDMEPVDLIFMDCQMPVMDGYEATRLIRNRKDEVRALPIVAVTANASPTDKELCLASGMNDFIAKPFTQRDIANALEYWLTHAALQR